MSMTLSELAERIGAELRGADADRAQRVVHACTGLEEAGAGQVAFLANPRYASYLKTTKAEAVIVAPDVEVSGQVLLVSPDPYYAFRNAMIALHGLREHPEPDGGPISPLASVHPTATIGAGTQIHPFAAIGPDVVIGSHTVIYPHCTLGAGVRVGDGCQIYPNVTIYDGCVLGNRVTLHSGCVIGQDGFGYATHGGAHHKIPQAGHVTIGDDVEMGACCTVDRSTLGATVIGAGTKFSNLIAIGHGTKVGRHNLFVAQVGLAGSVVTGDYVAMGGQAGVAGHLKIGSMVQIAAKAGVHTDIPDGETWGGAPARPFAETRRVLMSATKLPDLNAKVRRMEREIKKLRERLGEQDA